MEITTVHVMRHGEVDNPLGLLYGRLPGFGLTERGHAMAARVAEHLVEEGRDITTVIASPLLRAQQSAAPTAGAFGVEVACDPRLVEAGNAFEGVPVNADRAALARPQYWHLYTHPLRPSWGEPYTAVASRMAAALSGALREARGHEALVVSHQMPIVTLTRFAQCKPLPHSPLSRTCSLASVTSFIFEGSTLVGISYQEPAADLLQGASDMTPGRSEAGLRR